MAAAAFLLGFVPDALAGLVFAGICLERNSVLLTRNVKHLSRVDGLYLSGET